MKTIILAISLSLVSTFSFADESKLDCDQVINIRSQEIAKLQNFTNKLQTTDLENYIKLQNLIQNEKKSFQSTVEQCSSQDRARINYHMNNLKNEIEKISKEN